MDAGKPPSRLYLWVIGIAAAVWLLNGVYWLATGRTVLGVVFLLLVVATVIAFGLLLRGSP